MNVTELYNLTQWVTHNIEETQIPQKYQSLSQILQRNAQLNQQQQPLESLKNELFDGIRDIPLKQLTKEQLAFLNTIGISQFIGEQGINLVEDILYKNVIDIATAAQKMQDIYSKLATGIERLSQIKTGLNGYVPQEQYDENNEVLIRVTFTGEAKIGNVVDFKEWGKNWYEIGRGIAMVHNATPEEVKIVGATSGSIVIELSTISAIAGSVAAIIFSALTLAEKVLEIKKKSEEIKNLQLENKKLADEIAKEAEKEKASGIEKISASIISELKIKESTEGDKVTALKRAITHLVVFTEAGGEVDFVLPENNEKQEDGNPSIEYKKLRERIQEIHLLENKIKLLEAKIREPQK